MKKRIVLCALAFLFTFAICSFPQTKKEKELQTRSVTTSASLTTNHQAVLTWLLPNTCADGSPCSPIAITVYRMVGTCTGATPPTGFTSLASLGGTVKTYTDANLAAATSYCYYVTASLAQPPAWSSTVTYTGGQEVTYNNQVYVALNNSATNLNQIPATATTFWSPASVESSPSNTAGGATGPTGAPVAPTNLTVTVQ